MDIVNKHHHMFLKKGLGLYCSKCGKAVMPDEYSRKLHASACKFDGSEDITAIIQEGAYYAYSFRLEDGKLVFLVSKLMLRPRNGAEDQFRGSIWKEIFRASFSKNSHEIEEEGLYNVDVWMKKFIEQHHMACLQPERGIRVIHQYFPEIMYVQSFGMFLDTYRQRGYSRKEYDVRRELEAPLDETVCEIIRESRDVNILAVTEFEKEGELFLVMDLGWLPARIIITKDFLVSRESYLDLSFLEGPEKSLYGGLKEDGKKLEILEYPYGGILERFAEKYPSFMLSEYEKGGGENPLVPMLSPMYSHALELLSKAGLGKICGFYRLLKDQTWFHAQETDIRRMLGLPVKVLKRLQYQSGEEFVRMLPRYAEIYAKKPQFLQMEQFTAAYNDMLRYNDVCHDGKGYTWQGINGVAKWSDQEILRTLRYLSGFSGSGAYVTYRDYLQMCRRIQNYPDGRFPKNLRVAHDHVLQLYQIQEDEYRNRQFMAAVAKEEYAQLATDSEEKSEEPYEVLTPSGMWDLVKESEKLHHCVRMYTEVVTQGRTYILFLRRREEHDRPFATMEVLPSRAASSRNGGSTKPTLIQLKAVNNTKAPADAQRFVCRWASEKGVRIDTRDIDARIVGGCEAAHPAA
ncbi:MAG: PcfJ domain-containing protein [Lachnospiraceae bacterium]|nr:PcfJ domain-containing protein [Lachnospiraceae bacterium]